MINNDEEKCHGKEYLNRKYINWVELELFFASPGPVAQLLRIKDKKLDPTSTFLAFPLI